MIKNPLISCIMLIQSESSFTTQSIWYFLRQTYQPKELIIIDSGDRDIAHIIPSAHLLSISTYIQYVQVDKNTPEYDKYNLACKLSRGEFIAHWHEDNWIGPSRLDMQYSLMQDVDIGICGSNEILHYHIESEKVWIDEEANKEILHVGTLFYTKSLWSIYPFSSIFTTDSFIEVASSYQMKTIDSTMWFIKTAFSHSEESGFHSRKISTYLVERVHDNLRHDADFYQRLCNKSISKSREINFNSLSHSSITLGAHFMVYDGYGSMAEYTALGMQRAGAEVNIVPFDSDFSGTSSELQNLIKTSMPDAYAPVIYFSWPRPEIIRFQSSYDFFMHTMWEGTQLPAGWSEILNNIRALIVPTRFVANVCRKSGVSVPISVVPDGIDRDLYHFIERPHREHFVTLIVGTMVERKHMQEAISAWQKAFDGEPHARLIIKSKFSHSYLLPNDPRILFVNTNEQTRGIAHWYEQADVLLALGSEGFGLPLIEGMATGLPVIALNSEGQSDICEEARQYLLPVSPTRWQVCNHPVFGSGGFQGVPDVNEVARQLLWVATHREEARELGKAASRWVAEHRNVWNKGPDILAAMEDHKYSKPSLLPSTIMWVPSWQTPCGISEYTGHIKEQISDLRVVPQFLFTRNTKLLHIQHEDGLFHDDSVTQCVQQARQQGVPVVVTQHSVWPHKRAWENDVDALVALTSRGAAQIRSNWPSKQVVHIPIGCPTWFPVRKQTREKVIGVFGFLERHKGFWQLLDVLREVSGTELLMFSYAKSDEMENTWKNDSAGLHIRRSDSFLPVDQIAHQLAREADILVYWYDEVEHVSASGAVRVGLATGVPVLTSRTSWFEDLRDVTYQPENLIDGVQTLLEDTSLRSELTSNAKDYCHSNSWESVAHRHLSLWQSILKS